MVKIVFAYGRYSKMSKTSRLPKRGWQTEQTQNRVFSVCYSDKHFVNPSPINQHFIWGQNKKSVGDFRILL